MLGIERLIVSIMFYQGEIDAHEDSFKSTDEAGQALLNTGHYASEEVKEKVCLTTHLCFCRLFANSLLKI